MTHYLVRLSPYRDGDKRTEGVVITFIDVTTLTRAEARQRVLIAELQHRTRNLLAVVQSIAQQTLGKGGTLEELSARLAALGRIQGLVSKGTDAIDLGDLIRFELDAVGALEGDKVHLHGATGLAPLRTSPDARARAPRADHQRAEIRRAEAPFWLIGGFMGRPAECR